MATKINSLSFLKKDLQVRKLMSRLSNGDFSLDTRKLKEEIQNLHAVRLVRRLSFSQLAQRGVQKKLIQAFLQNQATRSRATEIKMQVYEQRTLLEEAIDLIKLHLRAKYSNELGKNFRTVADRDSAITTVLSSAKRRLHRLEGVEEVADLLIDDIDKASWALKSVVDALAIHNAREADL